MNIKTIVSMAIASNLLVGSAFAEAAGSEPAGGGLSMILMVGVFIAIFYFLLIRPQSKQRKQQQTMQSSLAKGDEVITVSGIVGKISKLGDNYITLTLAEGVEVKFQKQVISTVLPKGSVKID